jgi:cytochrome c peroxidase
VLVGLAWPDCCDAPIAASAADAGSLGDAATTNAAEAVAEAAYAVALAWANPRQSTLEGKALAPLYGKTPVDLGLGGEIELVATLEQNAT